MKDDNIAFAEKAKKESHNKVVLKIYDNLPHSFHCHMEEAPIAAKEANDDLAKFLETS